MKPPEVIVDRCYECDSCQEFILTPYQAPECTSLRVAFPDDRASDYAREFGTERKVFRAIEKWANDKYKCLNAINFVTVVWKAGTTVRPILRRSFAAGPWPRDKPVHPAGGFACYGCSCVGCRPRRKRAVA